MKRSNHLSRLLTTSLLLFAVSSGQAETPPVFPGAIGFGTETQAGRGGQVIKVTNLNSKGEGSLREAIETKGPRIIVFEVGGVIDIDKKSLKIEEPFVTIAGQTAPSPGITIVRGSVSVSTHDALIQHIAVRPGDVGAAKGSGWAPDGIAVAAGHHIVIDHCSTTWAVDENLSVSGPRHDVPTSSDVTISNCLIAEGLDDSSHPKGPHSKGSLIHDRVQRVSIINCLYAHNQARNPYFKIGSSGAIVNNVIYNPGTTAMRSSWRSVEWEGLKPPAIPELSIVGNILIHGTDTRKNLPMINAPIALIYTKDNVTYDLKGNPIASFAGDATLADVPPVWPAGLVALPSEKLLERMQKNVGSRPNDRHPIDQRIIDQIKAGTGTIIDSQEEVGGYPQDTPTHRKLEVPSEGIDEWLASFSSI